MDIYQRAAMTCGLRQVTGYNHHLSEERLAADPDRRHRRGGRGIDPVARSGLRGQHDGQRGVRRLRHRGAPGFSLSASLFALAGFLAGAAVGGALITRTGPDRAVLLRAGVAAELILAVAALILAALSGAPGASHPAAAMSGGAFGAAATDALAALLAIAMGIQNAVARKLAVPDMTTTVLTMTLTGLAADLRAEIRGGAGRTTARAALGRRLLAIAAMLVGAITGAWLVLSVSPLSALILAAALLAVVTIGTAAAAARPAPWRTPPPRQ